MSLTHHVLCQHNLQAFTTPAAYTLLADAVPVGSRATANSVYSSGVYFGGACASLTVLLTFSIGWRDCSLLAGNIHILLNRPGVLLIL